MGQSGLGQEYFEGSVIYMMRVLNNHLVTSYYVLQLLLWCSTMGSRTTPTKSLWILQMTNMVMGSLHMVQTLKRMSIIKPLRPL